MLPSAQSNTSPAPVYNQGTVYVYPSLINDDDVSNYASIRYLDQTTRTVWNPDRSRFEENNVYVFEISLTTGQTIEIVASTAFGSYDAALNYATAAGQKLGQLPTSLLENVNTVVIDPGNQNGSANESAGVININGIDKWLASESFEEFLIHEIAHISLDRYAKTTPEWVAAQKADGVFASAYARDNVAREDMAETFLLYVAVKLYPDRIGEAEVNKILESFPNRLEYIDSLGIDLSVDVSGNEVNVEFASDDSLVFEATNDAGYYEEGVNLLANDAGEGLSIYSVNGQVIGDGATIEMAQGGLVYVNANGSIDFSGNGDFASGGMTGFSYVAQNDAGDRSTANVSIDVTSAITANNDSFVFEASDEGRYYADGANLLSNDEGTGTSIYSVNGQVIGDGAWIEMEQGGAVYVNANGRLAFDAQNEFARGGATGFTYVAENDNGARDAAQVFIDVEETTTWWGW